MRFDPRVKLRVDHPSRNDMGGASRKIAKMMQI